MRTISLHGKTFHLEGSLPTLGKQIPEALVVDGELNEVLLSSFKGKWQVMITVPSLDTPTCQLETKRFHQELSGRPDLNVIVISLDLPFAQKRWCGSEGIKGLHVLSDYKQQAFAKAFGVRIKELGLLARVVFVVNPEGKLTYTQVVPVLSDEPDYSAVLAQLP